MLYNNADVCAAIMNAKEKEKLLDEFYFSSDALLKSLKQSIDKVGRHSENGYLLLDATSDAVYTLMAIRSKYNKLKKIK